MKRFWSVLAIALVLVPSGMASAGTVSISQEIHLTGIVPPMRNIVVDGRGNIIEIISNTLEPVTPKVYLNSLQSGIELPLTPAVQSSYEHKIQNLDLYSVDRHFAVPAPRTTRNATPALLAVLERISSLHLPVPSGRY